MDSLTQLHKDHQYADGIMFETGLELRLHRCVKCGWEWFEFCDANDYPSYCPGCGKDYQMKWEVEN